MRRIYIIFALSGVSVLSLAYAVIRQDWLGVFIAVILWILLGSWFLILLEPQNEKNDKSKHSGPPR